MEMNNVETLPGLYGSEIRKNKAVGYCMFHKTALTVKTLKGHGCLGKQCDALERYMDHDFWRQHEQKKARKKERKKTLYIGVS